MQNYANLKNDILILSAFFENSPNLITVSRMSDNVFVAVNPAFERITGITEAEIVGKTPVDLGFVLSDSSVDDLIDRLKQAGKIENESMYILDRDGNRKYLECSCFIIDIKNESYVISIAVNVTEKHDVQEATKLDEMRMQSLLRISQYTHSSVQELLDFALNEIVAVSSSQYGYIFYYSEKTQCFSVHAWSDETIAHCAVQDPPHEYYLENTGIWGEAVRQRKPIIINDFDAPDPHKKGLPAGHLSLKKFMTVPVILDGEIVAVVGVANKESDYTEADVRQLSLMMDSVWKMVKQKQAVADLAISEEKYRSIVQEAPIGVFQTTVSGQFKSANPALVKMLKCDSEEDAIHYYSDIATKLYINPDQRMEMLEMVSAAEGFVQVQTSYKCKDGSIIHTNLYIRAARKEQEVLYLEGFVEDISQKFMAEEEKRILEQQKRTFYRDTIMSVTDGKLEICDLDAIEPYLNSANMIANVCEPSDAAYARHNVEDTCVRFGIKEQTLSEFMIGVGEAITNSIKHANYGIICVGHNEHETWVAVSDKGSGIESLVLPRAVLRRGFSTKPSMGLGYSIMLDTVDRMLLKTDKEGTTVVLILNTAESPFSVENIPDFWNSIPSC